MSPFMFSHSPFPVLAPILFVLLIIWSLIWKGMALWKSARRGEKVWFVALLIVNTAGILDILYLYVFSNDKVKSGPVGNPNSNPQV